MKPINELIEKATSQIGKQEDQEQKQESASFINLVFHNLKLIFPAWRQNFKTENDFNLTKSLWLETLISENINTQEQIERALKCARNYDSAFFPSIGQFVKWSKKEAPRVNEQAYKQYQQKLRPFTQQEYAEKAKTGAQAIRDKLNLK